MIYSMRCAVRPFVLVSAVCALLTACGGGDATPPTTPPTPTPPTPPPVAASISVVAGDGQQAEPNALVPTAPSVVVRSASGVGVANALVTFRVDSGGGSVGSLTATTNAAGEASVGSWRLGASEGPQLLTATVASLAPVHIRATARIVQKTVATQTVSTTGGTLTVNRPESPLHGASLRIDKGALPGATSISLVEMSTSALVLPTGLRALSPGLGIASNAGALAAGALVSLPTTAIPGTVVMVAVAEPGTGKITLLPTVKSTTTTITALLTSFDARQGSPIALSLRNTADDELKIIPFLVGINEELLAGPIDVGFRPGVDDWDFKPMGIATLPFLPQQDYPLVGKASSVHDGIVSTALWYYANRRKAGGPPLYRSTQEAPGQPLSSRMGIRWAALAEGNVPSFNQVGSLAALDWDDFFTGDRAKFARLQFLAIKALMLTTERPTPVALLNIDNPDEFNTDAAPLAIAYRAEGNTLYLAIPAEPGREFQVQYTEQGMTPFNVQPAGSLGTVMQVKAVAGIAYVNVVNNSTLAEQWARVANRTIGIAEGWPTPRLVWEKADLDTAKVFLLDELQHWWECEECPDRTPLPPQLPSTASHVQRLKYGRYVNNQIPALSAGSVPSLRFTPNDVFVGESTQQKIGSVVYHPVASNVELGHALGWLDFVTTTYRRLKLRAPITSLALTNDTTITITVTPSETPPIGTRYRWVLKTDNSRDSIETTVPTHTRDLEASTNGWLIFSALEGEFKRPIARDSIEITAAEPVPVWRITSISDADSLFDEEFRPFTVFGPLLVRPTSGIILTETVGGRTALRLRAKRTGTWADAECCPIAPYNSALEQLLTLGTTPATTNSYGPYFGAFAQSVWSQSTTNLDAGTMTGRSSEGTNSYRIKDQGTQTGPDVGIQITATRSGRTMTGVITLTGWYVDETSGEVDTPPSLYRFPFTATRIR
jgi:hypothetical protein